MKRIILLIMLASLAACETVSPELLPTTLLAGELSLSGIVAWQGKRFRGELEVYLNDRGLLNVINRLDLEDVNSQLEVAIAAEACDLDTLAQRHTAAARRARIRLRDERVGRDVRRHYALPPRLDALFVEELALKLPQTGARQALASLEDESTV